MKKRFNWNRWNRKTHLWGALIIIVPISIVIATGVMLQLKKEVAWIQPPTSKGDIKNNPQLSFNEILKVAQSITEANIETWTDVDRLDVRIDKGIVKVRGKNRWEIQIDTYSGEVLQVAYRRSDLIESIHDGSWFHEKAKLWIFFPAGIILFILWFTGVYMAILPLKVKWKRRRERKI